MTGTRNLAPLTTKPLPRPVRGEGPGAGEAGAGDCRRRGSSKAQLTREGLDRFCALDDACQRLMKGAFDRMGLTARSYDRILRVARTIADLDGGGEITTAHLAEALQYRPPEYLRR